MAAEGPVSPPRVEHPFLVLNGEKGIDSQSNPNPWRGRHKSCASFGSASCQSVGMEIAAGGQQKCMFGEEEEGRRSLSGRGRGAIWSYPDKTTRCRLWPAAPLSISLCFTGGSWHFPPLVTRVVPGLRPVLALPGLLSEGLCSNL